MRRLPGPLQPGGFSGSGQGCASSWPVNAAVCAACIRMAYVAFIGAGKRKWPEWVKKVILYHRCFQSAWLSLLPHVVIIVVPLRFAIPAGFEGSS